MTVNTDYKTSSSLSQIELVSVYGTLGSGWVLPLEVSLVIVGGLNLYHLFLQILLIDQEVAIIVIDLCIILLQKNCLVISINPKIFCYFL